MQTVSRRCRSLLVELAQRRNATIRGARQQLLSNTKHTLKLITKNSRTVGAPYHQWAPVTRRSSHPIVMPLNWPPTAN